MARKKSVKKRKYTRRAKVRKPNKTKLAALQLQGAVSDRDHYIRMYNAEIEKVRNLTREATAFSVFRDEKRSEIIWLKQLVQNLEKKIGQGVTVTTATA